MNVRVQMSAEKKWLITCTPSVASYNYVYLQSSLKFVGSCSYKPGITFPINQIPFVQDIVTANSYQGRLQTKDKQSA